MHRTVEDSVMANISEKVEKEKAKESKLEELSGRRQTNDNYTKISPPVSKSKSYSEDHMDTTDTTEDKLSEDKQREDKQNFSAQSDDAIIETSSKRLKGDHQELTEKTAPQQDSSKQVARPKDSNAAASVDKSSESLERDGNHRQEEAMEEGRDLDFY